MKTIKLFAFFARVYFFRVDTTCMAQASLSTVPGLTFSPACKKKGSHCDCPLVTRINNLL
jgi:hypothetical protein